MTAERIVALPGELSTPERLQHGDDWDIETVAGTSRQVISSPVRKLLDAGAITMLEADAAAWLRSDHDAAYASDYRSPLGGLDRDRVDGAGGKDYAGAMAHKADAGLQYRAALDYLGRELAPIAEALIVELGGPLGNTYRSVGVSLLDKAPAPEQSGAAKGSLVLVCRKLAVFYGLAEWRT